MTEQNKENKRAIGGNRVTARFHMTLAKLDPFKNDIEVHTGTIAFNVRGACFIVDYGLAGTLSAQIFREGDSRTVSELKLTLDDEPVALITNLKMKFLSEKKHATRIGIVVKFLSLNPNQLDKLNELVLELPPVSRDEDLFSSNTDVN